MTSNNSQTSLFLSAILATILSLGSAAAETLHYSYKEGPTTCGDPSGAEIKVDYYPRIPDGYHITGFSTPMKGGYSVRGPTVCDVNINTPSVLQVHGYSDCGTGSVYQGLLPEGGITWSCSGDYDVEPN